jgi:transmembrane sensor
MDEREKNKLLQEAGKRSLTPAERDKLDNWYAAFDVSGKDLEVFHDSEHEEKVRTRLLDRIVAQIPESKQQPILKTFFLNSGNWMKVAAVFAFFMISIPVYNYIKKTSERNIADAAVLNISNAQTGKMLKVILEDGSEIWLNSGSELKYPRHFSAKNREIYLEGEAFFKIAHDQAKPFIVNSGRLKTTVLGTSFNIRAYSGLDRITVNVATGKVGITASGKTLCLLDPNQQICFHTRSGAFEVTQASAKLAASWQDGKITLDGASFKELSLVVKNTWGLTLETKSDRLAAANFKTTFNTNNKIEDVMKTISKMTDAKYRIRDNIITLYE